MCGIIARISNNDNPIKTLEGLKFLEYRGYDSYGILLSNNKESILQKNTGSMSQRTLDKLKDIKSNIEIGHTRWGTHGGITQNNAHPHFDNDKKFYVVMNGIIENYLDLKAKLKREYEFNSETDTEIIPHMYSKYLKDTNNPKEDLLNATKIILKELEGEFSFIVKYKNVILCLKNINPIIIGSSSNETFISSDMGLVQNNSEKFYVLNDSQILISELKEKNEIENTLYENFNPIKIDYKISTKSEIETSNTHNSYMEKEIYEQKYLRNLITTDNLSAIKYLKNTIKNKKLILTAAGTSYHAAYYMHYMLLKEKINSQVILASELNNYSNVIDNSLIVIFSQSGETADLIYPLKNLRDNNEIFTITNTPNSTLDRFASRSIHLNCGREIGVASTKAFTFQIFVSYILKQELTGENQLLQLDQYEQEFDSIIKENSKTINEIATKFQKSKDFFFIGRDKYHPFALEGALKLKETSYIHAEGFAGGELKHGTLALIEEGVPVISIGKSQEIISNAIEIKTRGGVIIGISDENTEIYNYHLKIPNYYKEIFTGILMQLVALEITLNIGNDPDKPRNLAKSVTVK